MPAFVTRLPLQTLLAIDAVTCAAMGALLATAAGPVGHLTAISEPVLFWAGIALLPIAGFMAFQAMRRPVPAWAACMVVLGNSGWVLASLALPVLGLIQPNPLGWAFLILQAAAVALLTWMENAASRGDASPA